MPQQKKPSAQESSIIEIVRKMVAEGEPEERIIQSLKDLGIEEDRAKRLLLLGQADTFALLRSEISKIVRADIEAEKPKLMDFIQQEANKAAEKGKETMEKAVMADLKKYEKDITGQSKTFQEQINETVQKFAELSDRVRSKLNDLGEQVRQVQIDMDEFKLKGVGTRNKLLSMVLIALGVAFLIADLYMLLTMQAPISADSIIILVIMALVGIVMLFVATLI